MIPVKLRIEGFLSYQQPVELDFTGIDLACITGQNGAGKSSLLDAITWALFGRARKRDESVINTHPSVKAAEVILDFDYEGDRYRVQRSNPRGKTTSLEFFILSEVEGEQSRWKPLTEHTLRETDQKIVNILQMDFETFTNASFFLQGKADQFAVARPAERKRILSNILNLDVWETYREEASLRRRAIEREVRELDGRLSEIQSELDEGPERKARLEELQGRLANLTEQRKSQAKIYENVQRLHTSLQEQHKMVETLRAQMDVSQRDYDRINATLAQRLEERTGYEAIMKRAAEIEKAYSDWQTIRTDLGAMDEIAETYRQHEALRQEPLRIIHAEEARLEQEKATLKNQKAEAEQNLQEAAACETQIVTARQGIEQTQMKISRREALDNVLQELRDKFADAKAENPRLAEEGKKLSARIEQLKDTDSAECPVCGKPLGKTDRDLMVEELSEELETMRERYRENSELVKNYESDLSKIGAELADLKSAESELREANRIVDQLQNRAAALKDARKTWDEKGAPRLQEIMNTLTEGAFALEARQKLDAIKVDLEKLGYDLDAHEKLRQAEKEGRKTEEALMKVNQARASLVQMDREIGALESQEVEKRKELDTTRSVFDDTVAKLAASEAGLPDLAQAETDLYDIQEQENKLSKDVGYAEARVRVLAQQEERKAGLLDEREQQTHRIADLKQLERAFGKDGVPALLIEQALPEIEETTNDLLDRLTSGRMTFRFMTQRDYKDAAREDKKETLDIVISDSDGTRDYETYSGGEAFRINFSIRLALSKILARRAGARLQTLVIDEGFGSQDAQGRQRLVEAINLVRDDFEKILVITHLEELKDAFPTRIEVEKTLEGSQLSVIQA